VAAVAVSSVIFGLSHILQFVQLPALIAFGLVAAYLAERTDRLGPSIWAHVGFNATTVFVLLS
jgi:membrane protease YdiL (CAAX protease family)